MAASPGTKRAKVISLSRLATMLNTQQIVDPNGLLPDLSDRVENELGEKDFCTVHGGYSHLLRSLYIWIHH